MAGLGGEETTPRLMGEEVAGLGLTGQGRGEGGEATAPSLWSGPLAAWGCLLLRQEAVNRSGREKDWIGDLDPGAME